MITGVEELNEKAADCERLEYRLNIIHEGRLFDVSGMPCADGGGIEVIKTIINSLSLSD